MEVDDNPAEDQMVSFHSVNIKGAQNGGVHLNATKVATVYATSPPMMTDINIEEVEVAKFECDTAASHNIMSQELYNKLRSRRPDKIPKMKQEKLAIRLADGSVSSKQCGTISVDVKERSSKITRLDFFVMNGPNNLLG